MTKKEAGGEGQMKMLKLWGKLGKNIFKLLIPCILINLFSFTN
jgi:hypothetical protein